MNKFRLWLLAHGIEFEGGDMQTMPTKGRPGNVGLHLSVAVNHRYIGFDLGIVPFRGTYTDELDTPHAEIARQYDEGER